MVVTRTTKGTSSEKLYLELGLASFELRCSVRKLCHSCKIFNEKSFSYLFDLITDLNRFTISGIAMNFLQLMLRLNWFQVFKSGPSKIRGRQPFKNFTWSTLEYFVPIDAGLNSVGLNIFKKCLSNFKRPFAKSIFDIHNPYAIKLLIITHLSLSMFQEYIVRHCFQDTLNLLIDYGEDNERVTALSPVR